MKIGQNARNEFINQCSIDNQRFEKPIKRINVQTFSSTGVKYKGKHSDPNIKECTMERDLISKLLLIAINKNIDLAVVFTYPLTPVPLALSNIDGSMLKTDKSLLLRHLESLVTSEKPSSIDATIVDGFYFLHLMPNLPNTFGAVARHLLVKLYYLEGNEIHLIFDNIQKQSIKDCERIKRHSATNDFFVISGPEQECPSNFLKALRNNNFKMAFVRFIQAEWNNDHFAEILGEKVLYVTYQDNCYKF